MEPGTQLGPYEIQKQLGAGGMGEVYLATDARLGREVAIKVLPPEFATDPERLARFDQEARAAAALNHPHIAVVHDIGQEDGTYFMVQERLEGQTLRNVLEPGRPPLGKALDLCIEIAEALTAAHGVGIVHRDLKPENVFVSKDGHAKVLDFGLAKLMELSPVASPGGASMSPTMVGTVAGQVMGTAGYMAPEQIEGGEIDHRADVFAFGVLLYEMSTGRQPFAGRNVVDTLSLITNEPAPDLLDVDGSLPRDLQRILGKALAKDPAERYQSAADLLVDLRSLAADVEAGRAVPVAATGSVPVSGYPAWMLAAAAVVALLAGFFAAGQLGQDAPDEAGAGWVFDYPYPEGETPQTCCGRMFDIAPDGSYFAYSARVDGTNQIFLRRRDRYVSERISPDGGSMPSISPDGAWVAYTAYADNEDRLYKVALAGGDPFLIAASADGFYGINWHTDDHIYFTGDDHQLGRVAAVGGEPEVIEVEGLGDTEYLDDAAAVPGGQFVLASVYREGGQPGIAAVDWTARTHEIIVPEGSDPRLLPTGHLLYARGGTIYAVPFDSAAATIVGTAVPVLQGVSVHFSGAAQFAVADRGTLVWAPGSAADASQGRPVRLVGVDAAGNSTPLSDRIESYRGPAPSFDGSRVAVAFPTDGGRSDLWILELERGVLSRLTFDGGEDPVWSRDGHWIYYTHATESGSEIRRVAADFSADPETIYAGQVEWTTDVSPDGSELLFVRRGDGRNLDLMALSLTDTPEARTLAGREAFREAEGRYSADGRYVAYTSNESGDTQVYLREIDGERRWLISPGRGFRPLWSREDDGVFFYAPTTDEIQFAAISFEPEVRIAPPVSVLAIGEMSSPSGIFPDGRFLMRVRVVDGDDGAPGPSVIKVVPNWFEELNRLAPIGGS